MKKNSLKFIDWCDELKLNIISISDSLYMLLENHKDIISPKEFKKCLEFYFDGCISENNPYAKDLIEIWFTWFKEGISPLEALLEGEMESWLLLNNNQIDNFDKDGAINYISIVKTVKPDQLLKAKRIQLFKSLGFD